ncbi:variable surface protein [Plasmodium gonderi]|uniref:Variable surface protein n=1 Tax=Plasmodium gonderi TaxID=77519 RepID=A0A1Y1JNW8_PLAGO|nr:variable surface protein [Plasmodium gonderi]GAW84286.1 variable surface protein [Plasmodium gonderi]
MLSPQYMSLDVFLNTIFPQYADDYNSVTTDESNKDLRNKFSTMCNEFSENLETHVPRVQKIIKYACQEFAIYLEHINRKKTPDEDEIFNVNSSCNYFFYKLQVLMKSYKVTCKTVYQCYLNMIRNRTDIPEYYIASNVCAQENNYVDYLDENMYYKVLYLDALYYILYHLKKNRKSIDFKSNKILSSFKTDLSNCKKGTSIFCKLIREIDVEFNKIQEEFDNKIEHPIDKTEREFVKIEHDIDKTEDEFELKAHVYGTIPQASQEIHTEGFSKTIGKSITTIFVVSVFALIILTFIGYKYKPLVSFLQHRERNIIKKKNKKNTNILNSSISYEGIYKETTDNKYSLAYSSEGY